MSAFYVSLSPLLPQYLPVPDPFPVPAPVPVAMPAKKRAKRSKPARSVTQSRARLSIHWRSKGVCPVVSTQTSVIAWHRWPDYHADGIVGHPEAEHEAVVTVICCKEVQGYGQPRPRIKRLVVPCVSICYCLSKSVEKFMEHGWFHWDEVLEGCRVLCFQFHHQLLVHA